MSKQNDRIRADWERCLNRLSKGDLRIIRVVFLVRVTGDALT
jgi:hypothetical protein